MKRWITSMTARLALGMLAVSLAGCGGYADSPRSGSGVEVYGEIDLGVRHER